MMPTDQWDPCPVTTSAVSAAGLLLMIPETWTDLAGLVGGVGLRVWQLRKPEVS